MLLVYRSEEEARAVHEAISVLMKQHREEMRYTVEASAKEARVVFTDAVNNALEEAVSKVRSKLEMHRRRDVEEDDSVAKDDGCRRSAEEEEEEEE